MSAAEMREAAAKVVGAAALEHMFDRRGIKGVFEAIRDEDPEVWVEIVEATGLAALRALPDEEGMVERVANALRNARLTRPSIASRCVCMTDEAIAACVEDDLRDDARAALRAINGGEP